MKDKFGYFLCLLMAGVLFAACEKPVIEEELQETDTEKGNVVIRVTDVEAGWGSSSSRALTNVSDVCTRVAFSVFQEGKKLKYDYQEIGDENFGSYTVQLNEGKYQLFVVAHSGKKSATIPTDAPKAEFSNYYPDKSTGTGFTDTFYYYGDMMVSSEGATVNVSMKRATAMFRLVTTDVKPEKVKKFMFSYEGGAKILDGTTGYGTGKNNGQLVYVTLDDSLTGKPLQLDVYTILYSETGKVTFTIKAFDANEDIIYKKEFTDVEMKRNYITRYTGAFFTKDEPDVPDIPDTPDNPDDPDPNNPDNPDTPDNPDNPDNPNNPDTPETPDTPDNPDNPDKPDPNPGPGPAVPVIQIDPEWGGVLEYNF